MATRPSKHQTFLSMALMLSEQSTCARRSVGCILVDKNYHIIGSGYNGVPFGMEHCIDSPCEGAKLASGSGLDVCFAIHAEQNALMQCHDVHKINSAYITTSPCMHCIKMLLNTSCRNIYYYERYPGYQDVAYIWQKSGRNIIEVEI